MFSLLVFSLSLTISIIDLLTHRIPNRLTIALTLVLLLDNYDSLFIESIPAILIVFAVGFFAKIGLGDVKLLIALILTSTKLILSAPYFLGMALVSLALVIVALRTQGFRGTMIAFAPAILAPFVYIYLDI
jgi:Flp pilus assembly protein protease CpaA